MYTVYSNCYEELCVYLIAFLRALLDIVEIRPMETTGRMNEKQTKLSNRTLEKKNTLFPLHHTLIFYPLPHHYRRVRRVPAMHQVLEIRELVDEILSSLRVVDLAKTIRVNRLFF